MSPRSPSSSPFTKTELSDKLLRDLKKFHKPESGREEISDTRRVGLRFRLYSSGKAVWVYEKRVKGGMKRKHTLGSWPEPIGLSEARSMALELEAEAAKGIDRVLIAEEAKLKNERAQASQKTLGDVIDAYHRIHLSSLATGDERRRQIETALKPHLGKPIRVLKRSDLQEPIDQKAHQGRRVLANRWRAALKAFTNWAWRRDYIDSDIGAALERAVKERARERVLSVAEVRQIWKATFELGELWGPMFRLFILTVQRRGSIIRLRKAEVDVHKACIFKPGSEEKNDKGHTTHLSAPALEEVQFVISQMSDGADTDYLFTTTGRTPVSGISKVKKRLDTLLGEDFEPWRIHDLRTAFSSCMADADIPESVADRVLNHVAGGSAPSAVSRVYNQAEMLPQRANALNKWAELVTGEEAKVVRLERP
ncbi:MAG: integrase family protein [Pseudomonadota bacterium]